MKQAVLESKKRQYDELEKMRIMNQDLMIDKVFSDIEDITLTSSNEIFVYMGTYRLKYKYIPGSEILLDDNDSTAEYKKYIDLENGCQANIDIRECDDFEKNNIVIYIPNARPIEKEYTFREDYYKLRRFFCKEMIINGQESALRAVTSVEIIEKMFSVENYMLENGINPIFYEDFAEAAICNKKNNIIFNNKALVEKKIKKLGSSR